MHKQGQKRHRERRLVSEVHDILGPYFFRRAYRMTLCCFEKLVSILIPHFQGQRSHVKAQVNGPIREDVRIAAAIRYFAGASVYDLATTFGIAVCEVYTSVWEVTEAILGCPSLAIAFPEDHNEQRELAARFKAKSGAHFDCCVGAIDGILIWMKRPSAVNCATAKCDAGKFMCGRKKKFGLNCQAICDADGRFLAVGIRYPGSTADCLAFEGMAIYNMLKNGLLAPNLCLFGDNAYINSSFMATPYQGGNLSGSRDAYNFYHSQLRITIECAFGSLTQRWGILRSPFPASLSLKKIIHLTLALFRLHNFCLSENQQEILRMTAQDECSMEMRGAIPLVATGQADGQMIPRQLIGGGHHYDGVNQNERRRLQRLVGGTVLPREQLHGHVASQHLQRPRVHGRL